MKILYDYQAFIIQTHGGVSKCFTELITHLPENIDYQIGIKESDNIYLKDKKLIDNLRPCGLTLKNFLIPYYFKGKGRLFNWINQKYPQYPSSININKNYCIEIIRKKQFDIFHPTFFDSYYLDYIGNKPFVLTIHDMIPELFPQYFSPKDSQINNKKILANKATHLIAVSEQTQKDLIEKLKIPEKKISVVYHGAPDNPPKQNNPIVKGAYFLYVGSRSLYKNFNNFIYSFAKVVTQYPYLKLVCTGQPFNNKETKLLQHLRITDNVIHLFINDQDLSNLYQHAIAFIYPSLYEGFGLPILEAYANECPVFLNRKSCFPEIAQDGALYFQLDNNQDTLTETIIKYINNKLISREELILRQNNQLKKFSWEKSANELAKIYENII